MFVRSNPKSMLFAALSVLVVSSQAFAAEGDLCSTDTDCGDGFYCACGEVSGRPLPIDPDGGAGDADCAYTCHAYEPFVPTSECATDEDCGPGYACEVVSSGGGAAVPPCLPGEDCPEPEPVEVIEYTACVEQILPCASDADCTDGFVCITSTYDICTDEAVPFPGEGEDPGFVPPPVDCETVTESYCAPPYVAPCQIDSDCGEGFTCIEAQSCACSGSEGFAPPEPDSGSGSSGSGDAGSDDAGMPAPPPEECDCEPTGEFYCELQTIACETDADCPADFTCMAAWVGTVPCYFDEATGEEVCETTEGPSQCYPQGWALPMTPGGPTESGPGEEVRNDDTTVDVPGEEPNLEDSPTEVPGPENTDDGFVITSERSSDERAGCSAAPAGNAVAAGWMLGLVALLRRRRKA